MEEGMWGDTGGYVFSPEIYGFSSLPDHAGFDAESIAKSSWADYGIGDDGSYVAQPIGEGYAPFTDDDGRFFDFDVSGEINPSDFMSFDGGDSQGALSAAVGNGASSLLSAFGKGLDTLLNSKNLLGLGAIGLNAIGGYQSAKAGQLSNAEALAVKNRELDMQSSQFDQTLGQRGYEFEAGLGQRESEFSRKLGQEDYQFESNLGQRESEFSRTLAQRQQEIDDQVRRAAWAMVPKERWGSGGLLAAAMQGGA
ncbi:hypothetical protein [Aquaspirillum soli]